MERNRCANPGDLNRCITLRKGETIILDFSKIELTTQSFVHALISDAIRLLGESFFERVLFKNCNETVQRIIRIVSTYMQQ